MGQLFRRRSAIAAWSLQISTAASTIVVVKYLGPPLGVSGLGVWLSMLAITQLYLYFDFGWGYVGARAVSARRGAALVSGVPAGPEMAAVLGWLKRVIFRSSLVAAVVMAVVFWVFLAKLDVQRDKEDVYRGAIILWMAGYVLLMQRPFCAVIEGNDQIWITRGVSAVVNMVCCVVQIGIGLKWSSMALLALPQLVLSVGAWVALGWVARRAVQDEALPASSIAPAGIAPRECLKIGAINLVGYIGATAQAPIIAIGVSPALVAPFHFAWRVSSFLSLAILQIPLTMLPRFTIQVGARKWSTARKMMVEQSTWVLILSILILSCFLCLIGWLSEHFMGIGRLRWTDYCLMATLGMLSNSSVVLGHFVLAAGRNPFFASAMSSVVLNVLLLYLLVPEFGVAGLMAAAMISLLCTSFWVQIMHGIRLLHELKCWDRERVEVATPGKQA